MTTTMTCMNERQALIEETEAEMERWSRYVDSLLRAFDGCEDAPPNMTARMEALRNKRDSVLTKVVALKRHRQRGWAAARRQLRESQRELQESWRTE